VVRIRIAVTSALVVGSLVASAHEIRRPPTDPTTTSSRRRFRHGPYRVQTTPATTAPATSEPPVATTVTVTIAPTTAPATSSPATSAPATTQATTATTAATPTTAAAPTTTRATVPASSPPPVSTPLGPLTKGLWQDVTPPVSLHYDESVAFRNYGTLTVALAASDPRVIYVGTCYQGLWKSSDAGASWVKINTGTNGDKVTSGVNWTVAVDPTNPNVVYTTAGSAGANLLWKSTDGGVNWQNILTGSTLAQTSPDVYSVAIDPTNAQHLLVGFHGDWQGRSGSGLIESKDGGATWTLHPPSGSWGHSHYAFFVSSTTWLLATQDSGFWRTTDSGASWSKVSNEVAAHGASQLYKASNGTLYVAALRSIMRSTDNGASWTRIDAIGGNTMPGANGGYYAIVGDGTTMYVQPGAAWDEGQARPFYVSAETDGVKWTAYNSQNFSYGPMALAFDAKNGILYASNWNGGFWRLKV